VETTIRHERIEDEELAVNGVWPTYHYDNQNTSYSSKVRGVRSNGTPYWRIKKARTPIVKDDRIYMPEGGTIVARDTATGTREGELKLKLPEMVGVNSPVAIADGRIYATTYETVVSFDSSTGSVLWSNQLSSGGLSVPTVDDHAIYFGNRDRKSSKVHAFEAQNGEKRWERNIPGEVVEAVAVDEELIYAGGDNLHAVDRTSGRERWTVSTTDPVSVPPVVTDNRVYIADTQSLYAVRKTGETDWKIPGVKASGLAVTERSVFYSTQKSLVAIDRDSGSEQWRFETQGDTAPPSVGSETVYFGTGVHERVFRALDTRTGDLRWRYEGELVEDGDTYRGGFDSAPVVVENAVYVVSGDGYLYAFGEN
jgi:outer membrane protein assembly factor BamB